MTPASSSPAFVRHGRRALVPALSGLVGIWTLVVVTVAPPMFWSGVVQHAPTLALILLLYVGAHVLRAIRLAFVATPALGLSMRSALLVHFTVAPWSLLLPYKLDEIVRLLMLAVVSGALARAVLVIVIDRLMDAVILLTFLLLAVSLGQISVLPLAVFLTFALVGFLLLFFLLPPVLLQCHRHLMRFDFHRRGLRALQWVTNFYRTLEAARSLFFQVAPIMFSLSVVIWLAELAIAGLVVGLVDVSASFELIAQTLVRTGQVTWQAFFAWNAGATATREILAHWIMFLALVGLMPVAAHRLLRRMPLEPRRLRVG